MKLREIFDSKLNLTWQQNGKFLLTKFKFNDLPFIIQIEKRQVLGVTELNRKVVGEVSFFKEDKQGDNAFSTSDESPFPVKIYGIILNALIEMFARFDCFYFTAERRHSQDVEEFESKLSIYETLADRLAKRTGANYYVAENTSHSEFLVSKILIDNDTFKNPLKEAMEHINFQEV